MTENSKFLKTCESSKIEYFFKSKKLLTESALKQILLILSPTLIVLRTNIFPVYQAKIKQWLNTKEPIGKL